MLNILQILTKTKRFFDWYVVHLITNLVSELSQNELGEDKPHSERTRDIP